MAQNGFRDWVQKRPYKEATLLDRAKDVLVDVGQGVVGAGEAAVGLANIPTFGYAGKALNEVTGYDPKKTRQILSGLYSEERQQEQQDVSRAFDESFLGGLGEAVVNPAVASGAIIQSLPLMVGGRGIATGLTKLAPGIAPALAGGIGEGAITAASQLESIRQESENGEINGKQYLLGLGAGALTGVIGAASGKLAGRFGIDDIDIPTTASTKEAMELAAGKSGLRRFAEGATVEGAEEFLQSGQEQALSNVALNKPVTEGMSEALGMGALTGAAMGGPMSAYNHMAQQVRLEADNERQTKLEELKAKIAAIKGEVNTGVVTGTSPVTLRGTPTLEEQQQQARLQMAQQQSIADTQLSLDEVNNVEAGAVAQIAEEAHPEPIKQLAAITGSLPSEVNRTANEAFSISKTFNDFKSQMVKFYGDNIKPYLVQLYNWLKTNVGQKFVEERGSFSTKKLDVSMAPEFARKKEQAKAEGANFVFAPLGIKNSFASKLAEQAKEKGMLLENPSNAKEGDVVYVSTPGKGRGYTVTDNTLASIEEILNRGALVRTDNKYNAMREHNKDGEGVIYRYLESKGYKQENKGDFTQWSKQETKPKASISQNLDLARQEIESGLVTEDRLNELLTAYKTASDEEKKVLADIGGQYREALKKVRVIPMGVKSGAPVKTEDIKRIRALVGTEEPANKQSKAWRDWNKAQQLVAYEEQQNLERQGVLESTELDEKEMQARRKKYSEEFVREAQGGEVEVENPERASKGFAESETEDEEPLVPMPSRHKDKPVDETREDKGMGRWNDFEDPLLSVRSLSGLIADKRDAIAKTRKRGDRSPIIINHEEMKKNMVAANAVTLKNVASELAKNEFLSTEADVTATEEKVDPETGEVIQEARPAGKWSVAKEILEDLKAAGEEFYLNDLVEVIKKHHYIKSFSQLDEYPEALQMFFDKTNQMAYGEDAAEPDIDQIPYSEHMEESKKTVFIRVAEDLKQKLNTSQFKANQKGIDLLFKKPLTFVKMIESLAAQDLNSKPAVDELIEAFKEEYAAVNKRGSLKFESQMTPSFARFVLDRYLDNSLGEMINEQGGKERISRHPKQGLAERVLREVQSTKPLEEVKVPSVTQKLGFPPKGKIAASLKNKFVDGLTLLNQEDIEKIEARESRESKIKGPYSTLEFPLNKEENAFIASSKQIVHDTIIPLFRAVEHLRTKQGRGVQIFSINTEQGIEHTISLIRSTMMHPDTRKLLPEGFLKLSKSEQSVIIKQVIQNSYIQDMFEFQRVNEEAPYSSAETIEGLRSAPGIDKIESEGPYVVGEEDTRRGKSRTLPLAGGMVVEGIIKNVETGNEQRVILPQNEFGALINSGEYVVKTQRVVTKEGDEKIKEMKKEPVPRSYLNKELPKEFIEYILNKYAENFRKAGLPKDAAYKQFSIDMKNEPNIYKRFEKGIMFYASSLARNAYKNAQFAPGQPGEFKTFEDYLKQKAKEYAVTGWNEQQMFNEYIRSGGDYVAFENRLNRQANAVIQSRADAFFEAAGVTQGIKTDEQKKAIIDFLTVRFPDLKEKFKKVIGRDVNRSVDYRGMINLEEHMIDVRNSSFFKQLSNTEQQLLGTMADYYIHLLTPVNARPVSSTVEMMSPARQVNFDTISYSTMKWDKGILPSSEDFLSKKDNLDAFEQQIAKDVAVVGRFKNPIVRAFYGLIAKAFNADLVIVSDDNYRSRYIPRAFDGRSKLIINTRSKVPFNRLFAHELFHHVVAKSTPEEYKAYKDAVSLSVSEDFKRKLLAKDITSFNKYLKTLDETQQEEINAEIFAHVVTNKDFFEQLSKTFSGKSMARKVVMALLDRAMKFKDILHDNTEFVYEKNVVIDRQGMNEIFGAINELIGKKGSKYLRPVKDGETKYYTALGAATIEELKGYTQDTTGWFAGHWGKIFPKGTKTRKEVMTNIENMLKDIIRWIEKVKPSWAYADFGATEKEATLAYEALNGANYEVAKLRQSVLAKHATAFDGLTDKDKTRIHDILKRGIITDKDGKILNQYDENGTLINERIDLNTEEGRARAIELGITEPQIEAFRDMQKEVDKIYEQLIKIYPDLPKFANHFGQSMKWRRANGVVMDDEFEWAINPEFSKLEGDKRFLKDVATQMTTEQIAERNNIKPSTVDPLRMFEEYAEDAYKLIYLREFIKKAQQAGLAKQYDNQYQAMQEGYVPVDDNATRVFSKQKLVSGFKVLVDGKPFQKNGEDAVYFTEEEANQKAAQLRESNKEFGSEVTVSEDIQKAEEVSYFRVYYEKDGTKTFYENTFKTKEEAKAFATAKNAEGGRTGRYHVDKVTKQVQPLQTAQVYFTPALARMVNIMLAKDHFRSATLFGFSGEQLMNLKNKLTSWEFAFSMFHAATIAQETIASSASWVQARAKLEGKQLGFREQYAAYNPIEAVRDARKINLLVELAMSNNEVAENPVFKAELNRLLGTSDADVFDIIKNFYMSGGLTGQDKSLRHSAHNLTDMKYRTEPVRAELKDGKIVYHLGKDGTLDKVADLTKATKDSVKDAWSKALAEQPNHPLKAMFKAGEFTALEATTAWLMEQGIPMVKMAMWTREYTLKLDQNRAAIESGAMTKEQIARDTMKFIEDRFGEVNWKNMWMKPTIKTSLQFMFRSYTWFTGSWKALAKAGIDIGKTGWFFIKGEKYVMTEKGRWGMNAMVSHLMAVMLISTIYQIAAGISGGEVPDDEDEPWLTSMLFPRIDPLDPSARVTIPSYVSEGYKMALHLGLLGTHPEPLKLVSGRFNSLVGRSYDLIRNENFRGVTIADRNDSFVERQFDRAWYLLHPMPIMLSSITDEARDKGIDPTYILLAGAGVTSAPAAALRSDATNLAFELRRKEYKGKEISEEEFEQKADLKRALYALQKGDKGPLNTLIKEGKVSQRQVDIAMERVPRIGNKPNPKYKAPLSAAIQGLTIDSALEVWEKMSENEKKKHKQEIIKKYGNMMSRQDKSPNDKNRIRQQMRDLGIIR